MIIRKARKGLEGLRDFVEEGRRKRPWSDLDPLKWFPETNCNHLIEAMDEVSKEIGVGEIFAKVYNCLKTVQSLHKGDHGLPLSVHSFYNFYEGLNFIHTIKICISLLEDRPEKAVNIAELFSSDQPSAFFGRSRGVGTSEISVSETQLLLTKTATGIRASPVRGTHTFTKNGNLFGNQMLREGDVLVLEGVLPVKFYSAYLELFGQPEIKRFYLKEDIFTIGRNDNCSLKLDDNSVSRSHARISAGKVYNLEDLNSSNGTFLNDKKIEEKTFLPSGSRIKIGQSTLLFRQLFAGNVSRPIRSTDTRLTLYMEENGPRFNWAANVNISPFFIGSEADCNLKIRNLPSHCATICHSGSIFSLRPDHPKIKIIIANSEILYKTKRILKNKDIIEFIDSQSGACLVRLEAVLSKESDAVDENRVVQMPVVLPEHFKATLDISVGSNKRTVDVGDKLKVGRSPRENNVTLDVEGVELEHFEIVKISFAFYLKSDTGVLVNGVLKKQCKLLDDTILKIPPYVTMHFHANLSS